MITYLVVAFMFFVIGTTLADLWAENKDIPPASSTCFSKA